ncbi:DUF3558 domain-containing protein [Amycolatopsis sp. NPDC059657]|uniref:DUF3558 domain-containing protein n=1 Tax=Amycolatopsis sp. NPDC059657 TaxID=3346899 RepID=UPI00366AA8AB
MRTFLITAVAAAGLTLAGCSHTTPGNATTAPSTSGSSSNGPVVPQVTNPLDTTKFEQNPCDVLTKDQARELANLTTTRLDAKAPGGAICGWQDENHNDVNFSLNRTGGLETLYRNHRSDDPGYFEPVPSVAGYPAVFASISDGRAGGTCTLSVGVSKDVAMVVSSTFFASSPNRSDPCPLVQKAAEMAIATLKAGS